MSFDYLNATPAQIAAFNPAQKAHLTRALVKAGRAPIHATKSASAPKALSVAAQQSWVTRRAVGDVRAASKLIAAAAQFAAGESVSMWLDESAVGSGSRVFIVREVGDKSVTLYYPPLLTEITVDRRSFDKYARPYKTTADRAVARVDAAACTADRCKIDYSPRAVKSINAAVDAYFASGGAIHVIPQGKRALPGLMSISDVARLVAA